MSRPKATQRLLDGLGRLRHNPDFVVFREYLEAELVHCKDLLVEHTEDAAFRQIQGRARQLNDLLKHINSKE